jgi:adenylosuccinate lyase
MNVCPIGVRYGREQILSIFEEGARLNAMLKVEVALAQCQAKYGIIPKEAAKDIEKAVTGGMVKLETVREIENEIGHDVMAMVKALSAVAGRGAPYVHFGATSNDIIDTSTALQLKEALQIIKSTIVDLEAVLADRAFSEKDTIMLGRTHGQAALPITFGFKLSVYLLEMDRQLERIEECEKRIVVGKMSGAVGTGASFGKSFFSIQEDIMERLGISLEQASGQIVGRDRYAEMVCVLSNAVTTCERMATEVRNLQRTEIDEVEEYFDSSRQVGSSTMAQKRNPVKAENICGLARIVRAFATPSFENMILWHERDLTNSSAERIIIPHVLVLTDDILAKTQELFSKLQVKKENMLRNLEKAKGLIMAERVMLQLAERIGRQEAHEAVRTAAMESVEKGVPFRDTLLSSTVVAGNVNAEELDKLLDATTYTGHAAEITERAVKQIKNMRALHPPPT